jgi:hypothetical protein
MNTIMRSGTKYKPKKILTDSLSSLLVAIIHFYKMEDLTYVEMIELIIFYLSFIKFKLSLSG